MFVATFKGVYARQTYLCLNTKTAHGEGCVAIPEYLPRLPDSRRYHLAFAAPH